MADARPTLWWRIEISAKGAVLSCKEVEREGRDEGAHVLYVPARDQREAGRAAWNLYCRRVMHVRRAKLKAENRCRCGRANDREPGKRCSICLEEDKKYKKRQRAREAGKPIEPLNRQVALNKRREQERQEVAGTASKSTRLEVLIEVREAWQSATSNGAFTRWLRQAIADAGGREVA
jgi:hypothetical protein